MLKILFICYGNICRSPMAESIMKDLAAQAGRCEDFYIESAATSTEEIYQGIGNPVYPPAREMLRMHGLSCEEKRARQIRKEDYEQFDLLIGMDQSNVRAIRRMMGGDPEGKINLLMAYTDHPREVADPWYTGDFQKTYDDILEGCRGLLETLT